MAAADGATGAAAGTTPSRCGFVAIVGAPNAGKSTLTNALVGGKVSIVTPKVQTTRTRVTAIAVAGAAQVIFVDTPGIFVKASQRLERAMVQAAWSGAVDADVVVLVLDAARGRDADSDAIIAGLRDAGRKAVLVLNKVDLVRRPTLLALSAELNAEGVFTDTFMISAESGDGVDDLLRHLAAAVPAGPWHYPDDQLADMPMRLLAAEITREQAFLQLQQELPYAITVETESWQERSDGSVRIEQVVYVRRPTQKGIVLGRRGQRIREIGAAARKELTALLDRPVHLFLFVKVRENWQDDPERYRQMGLDYPH